MTTNYWKRLQSEIGSFPWKQALVRMAADFVAVNASLIAAFMVWFFVQAVVLQAAPSARIAQQFKTFLRLYWLLWSGMGLMVFHLNGFYTRTRGYAGRYKMWVIVRAVTVFAVSFVFTDYFLFRGNLAPQIGRASCRERV